MRVALLLALALVSACGQRFEVRGEVGFGAIVGEYLPKIKGEVIYDAEDDPVQPHRLVCL